MNSKYEATIIIIPVTTNCQKESTLITTIPTFNTDHISAPINVPSAVPLPPAILVPPIAAAAIAFVS